MLRRQRRKLDELFEAAKQRRPEEKTVLSDKNAAQDKTLPNKNEQSPYQESKTNDFIDLQAPFVTPTESYDPDELPPGTEIDSYRIIKKIGSGGMGKVYLALDPELNREVALKILPNEFTGDTNRIRRFQQEAEVISKLNHPNILTIHKIGHSEQTHYIVTEYVDGQTLRDIFNRGITLSEALDAIIQVASALKAAHEKDIIHRDIKPENVMVRRDRYVKVLDFGLAKLIERNDKNLKQNGALQTQSGILIGTPIYMSPEQIGGEKVDHRTDLFSLGSLLYEGLTGKRVFQGENFAETISNIARFDPPPPSKINPQVSPELDRVALKLLQRKPDKRYQTADELITDLREINAKLQGAHQVVTLPVRAKAKTFGTKPFSTLSKFVERPRNTILLSAGLLSIWFLMYYVFSPKAAPVRQPEAIQLFNNGTEAIRDGVYFKASKLLEEAVRMDNNFALAHARLAEAWIELDYVSRAQNELLKARNLQQNEKSILPAFSQSEDSLYIEAINATVLRDFSKAVEAYQSIASRNPDKAYVYLDLGRSHEKNEETDKAIEAYEKAATVDSQYGAAFLRIGILRNRKGEFEKGYQAFDKAENMYDRLSNDEGVAEVKLQRGVSFNLQEKLPQAREQFEQVLKMPRANKYQQIRALRQISSVCYSGGDTTCDEEYAAKAINWAKEERMLNLATNGLIDLGNTYLGRAEYDKAERYFQEAVEYARKDEAQINEARALLSLGNLRIQQKKPDEATDFIKQALPFFQSGNYNKQVFQATLLLGRASDIKEDFDGALQTYEQVASAAQAPVAEKAYANMLAGNILMHQEKYPQALSRFEQSYELYQSLNNSFYGAYTLLYLSDVLFQLGRFPQAKEKLQKAGEILKEGHSLIPTVNEKIRLLNAQIALSNRNFPEALKEAQQLKESKDPSTLLAVLKILGLAQTNLSPNNSTGLQNVKDAVLLADKTKKSKTINSAKLALAEAYLQSNNHQQAIETALQAKDYFIPAGQIESGWRAWVIAALACQEKNDFENAKKYAANGLNLLTELKNIWGQETSNIYLAKPDINVYLKYAENLAKF